jgi:hypothetical protein
MAGGSVSGHLSVADPGTRGVGLSSVERTAQPVRARVAHASREFMEAVYQGRRDRALKFGTAKAYRAARADHQPGDRLSRERCLRSSSPQWQDWWPQAAWMCPVTIDYAGVDYPGAIGLFMKERQGRWVVREYFRIAG